MALLPNSDVFHPIPVFFRQIPLFMVSCISLFNICSKRIYHPVIHQTPQRRAPVTGKLREETPGCINKTSKRYRNLSVLHQGTGNTTYWLLRAKKKKKKKTEPTPVAGCSHCPFGATGVGGISSISTRKSKMEPSMYPVVLLRNELTSPVSETQNKRGRKWQRQNWNPEGAAIRRSERIRQGNLQKEELERIEKQKNEKSKKETIPKKPRRYRRNKSIPTSQTVSSVVARLWHNSQMYDKTNEDYYNNRIAEKVVGHCTQNGKKFIHVKWKDIEIPEYVENRNISSDIQELYKTYLQEELYILTWPAMVEDDPDYQQYHMVNEEDNNEEYHVAFFHKTPSRAWIKEANIKNFTKQNCIVLKGIWIYRNVT